MPNWNHIVRQRLAILRLPPEREIEIVEEVALDLEAVYEDALAAGLSEKEAEARSVQSYDWRLLECELSRVEQPLVTRALQPSIELIERKGGMRMNSLLQDLRFGARMLVKQPGLALIAVLTLALGIGANTTIFSAIESVILHPFSFPNQDRLVVIYERLLGNGVERSLVTPGALHDWRQQSRSFEQLVSTIFDDFTLTGGDRPEQLSGYRVSAGFFSALGAQPLLGRTFQSGEDALGREQVVVLKHSLWERLFAADPKILGQTIKLDSQTYTVIGVMPKEFNFPHYGGELWIPWLLLPADAQNRENHLLRVIGLLKPGVSRAQGEAEIRALSLRAQQQYPATNSGVEAYTVGLNEDQTRGTRMYLSFTLGAVLFVLLIACANVANLLLARSAARQKELAIRMALGAGRWRVMRQLLTESLMLAGLGGVLGLGFAVWGVTALANSVPQGFAQFIPGWERLGINVWALGFTMLASLLTGVACGLLPAWQATKSDFNETLPMALKDGGKGAASGTRNRWRNVLVVAEVALSLVLLIGAGLLIRSFIKILNTDLGFNPDNTLAMNIVLPQGRYTQPEQRINLYQELVQRVAALPGVAAVGLANGVPPGGWSHDLFQIVGRPAVPKAEQPMTGVLVVSPDYFAAVGTPLRAGRMFTAQDDVNAPRVVLVNEALARHYFANQSAIGQRLTLEDGLPYEIAGIVANTMNSDLDDAAEPIVYQALAQRAIPYISLIVRGQAGLNVTQLTSAIRREWAALDANLPISEAKTLHEALRERSSPKRVITALLGIFAWLALVMATVGLYAVMSFAVTQRTHEIGVRMALGAQARDVFSFVLKQGLKLVSLGIALGLLGAYAVTRLLSQILFGVTATDPLTFALVAGLLLVTALVACIVPAWRATQVDPLIALRAE